MNKLPVAIAVAITRPTKEVKTGRVLRKDGGFDSCSVRTTRKTPPQMKEASIDAPVKKNGPEIILNKLGL
jgi:hypothetical protein